VHGCGKRNPTSHTPTPLSLLPQCGRTALSRACATGDLEVVETLVDAGASLKNRDMLGMTPLLNAVYHGHPHVVRFLLARGADYKDADHVCAHCYVLVTC
jgi:ankyrin repeat protein